jgi:hypothetical protein
MRLIQNSRDPWNLLTIEVEVKSEKEKAIELLTILQNFGIPNKPPEKGAITAKRGLIAFQIPSSRVEEAILAIESSGFTNIRAYGYGEDPLRRKF